MLNVAWLIGFDRVTFILFQVCCYIITLDNLMCFSSISLAVTKEGFAKVPLDTVSRCRFNRKGNFRSIPTESVVFLLHRLIYNVIWTGFTFLLFGVISWYNTHHVNYVQQVQFLNHKRVTWTFSAYILECILWNNKESKRIANTSSV